MALTRCRFDQADSHRLVIELVMAPLAIVGQAAPVSTDTMG